MEKEKVTVQQHAVYIDPRYEVRSTSSLLGTESEEWSAPRYSNSQKMIKGAITFVKSVNRFTLRRKQSISGTETIDPLVWPEIGEMKWWPGILAIVTSYAIAPALTSVFFIGIGWKEYATNPSRWWQCGVYCSALWLTAIQAFGFLAIQLKVRAHIDYPMFKPSKKRALILYLFSALFAFLIWTVCYISNGNELVHPLVQSYSVAFAGIFGTALLQIKFLVPKEIDNKKDIFCLVLMGGAMIPVALLVSLFCLLLFEYAGGHTLCLGVFLVARVMVDMLMRKMISYTKSGFMEAIFIHISALANNIFFIYSLSYNPSGETGLSWTILAAATIQVGNMLYYFCLITSELEMQLGFENIKIGLEARWNRVKPDYPIMTEDQKKLATDLRSKLIYVVILDMASQLILPWWLPLQLALIIFKTPANNSINTLGFETSWASFIHRFKTALILNSIDIVNLSALTFFIRRKYPRFDPMRILHLIFEKFGFFPISGIMFILISIICFFITDCGIDPDEVVDLLWSR